MSEEMTMPDVIMCCIGNVPVRQSASLSITDQTADRSVCQMEFSVWMSFELFIETTLAVITRRHRS